MLLLSRVIVKLNLVSARGALDVLLEPPSQAIEVEDVAALQSLGLLDLLQADDAGVVDARWQVLRCVHVWEPLELVDQGPGLEEELE